MNNKNWKQRGRVETGKLAEPKSNVPVLKVKKMHPDAKLPARGTLGSGGLDLYAVEDVELWPGDIKGVKSGIGMEIPENCCGLLMTRSSFGKFGVRVAAGANCVDADYRGEVMVYLRNDSNYPFYINKGDRVAQIVIVPYIPMAPAWTEELTETERGDGGFGSTGR